MELPIDNYAQDLLELLQLGLGDIAILMLNVSYKKTVILLFILLQFLQKPLN